MPNIPVLSNATSTALGLSNLILVSPYSRGGYQPQKKISQGGNKTEGQETFLFHHEGEQTADFRSDITDHYVEENYAVNDHIALRPEIVTTQGYVGDLNDVTPEFLLPVKEISERLGSMSAYTPVLSQSAIIAYNTAFQAYQTVQRVATAAVSAWALLTGGEQPQSPQQVAYAKFYAWWRSRTLFTVQTPWCKFDDMAIESLRVIQDADSETFSTFEITFKKLRFTTTKYASTAVPSMDGRAAAQSSEVTNNGVNTPAEASESFSSKMSKYFSGVVR